MECQHARLLLAFWRRPADGLDADEQTALRQHLELCPECATLARDDRRTDGALGPPLRDVAVPDGLQGRLLQHLASQRRPFPAWRVAAAAAVLLAALGGGYLTLNVPTPLTPDEVAAIIHAKSSLTTADQVEKWFATQNVAMRAPPHFNYQYFRNCDIVPFKGRQVPMLLFYRPDQGDLAQVYVFAREQFQIGLLAAPEPGSGNIFIPEPQENPNDVYLVVPLAGVNLSSLQVVAR